MATSFTLTEAAKVTDRSRVTLRRWLDEGKFPGAFKDPTDSLGQWRIPATDLEAAGASFVPDDTGSDLRDGSLGEPIAVRLAVAEALAEERAKRLDDAADFARALKAQAEAVTALLARITSED